MEKNNSSNSSMCRKIRQALGSSPAFRAIHRISSYHQEPRPVPVDSNSPSSPPNNTAPLPQHPNVNTEGARVIPIKFDYSTPTSVAKGNSSAVSSIHGQAAKDASPSVGNSERAAKVAAKVEPEPQTQYVMKKAAAFKGEDKGKQEAEAPAGPLGRQHGHGHGLGVHSQQQGKKSSDVNDTFSDYIQRAKQKIRTVSNIGRGHSNPAPDHEANDTNKKDNQKDHFSEFIQLAKKKFRTTSTIGKTNSLKKG